MIKSSKRTRQDVAVGSIYTSDSASMKVTIPLVPPSVNMYTRHSKGMHFKSSEAKAFEHAMSIYCRGKEIYGQRFAVDIDVYFGPRQGRDVDNLAKCVLDGLAVNHVFRQVGDGDVLSDNHVDELRVRKFRHDRENPRTEVTVRSI